MSRSSDLAALMLRDGVVCYLCGHGSLDHDPWEIEHVIPRKRNGADEITNKRLAHRSCNRTKATHPVAV